MYHWLVMRQVRQTFESLSRGDYEPSLKGISRSITHTLNGAHPLAGTRRSVEGMRRWFQRLYLLCPQLTFEIKNIAVSGWPWDTTIAVEWLDRAMPVDGAPYVNEGVHIIKLRWGKAVSIHAYLDSVEVEALCRRLAAVGLKEASAPPIED